MTSIPGNSKRLIVLIKFMSNIKILKWQKRKKTFSLHFFLNLFFIQITVVQKYYKIFISKHFLQKQQNILIVVKKIWKPLIVCECGVLFLLPFIVINTITYAVHVIKSFESMETKVHNNTIQYIWSTSYSIDQGVNSHHVSLYEHLSFLIHESNEEIQCDE